MNKETLTDQIGLIFKQQQLFKYELRSSSAQERIKKLYKLRALIESHEDLIYAALEKDLRKSRSEAAIVKYCLFTVK
jgi:aldehyde dehydrogenase (NAD+)